MPVFVITRLRLKDPALFDEFLQIAVAVAPTTRFGRVPHGWTAHG